MKFLHLADLHLGKRVNGFDLLEDQRYILEQILALCDSNKVDAVVLAGDIYDAPVPPAAACTLLDWFLTQLGRPRTRRWPCPATMTAPRRLDYAAGLLANQNVYIAGQFRGAPRANRPQRPLRPRRVHAAALRARRHRAPLHARGRPARLRQRRRRRPVRLCAQRRAPRAGGPSDGSGRLCPPQLSGSETAPLTVGTVDSVDAAHFAGFNYTALGHIHRAQRVGSDTVRYAGAPLCYHLDECGMEKSATLVRLGRRGVDGIDTLPLHPRRAMRHIVGPLAKLVEHPADTGDYIWATLTDPTPQPDAMAMLRTAYPNAMRLDYRPQGAEILPADTAQSVRGKPFASLFEDFFTQMNGRPLTVEEARAVKALREEASK